MKKVFKILLVLIVLIIEIGFANSQDQSLNIPYLFSNNSYYETSIDYSSVLLKINTDRDAHCKYSMSSDVDYDSMEGNFDLSALRLHEKSLTELGEGIYKYYVKCVPDSLNLSLNLSELEIVLRVNPRVSAQIVLSKNPPLKAGKLEVTLITSKIVSSAPVLSYSFDGIVYNKIPLFGSEKIWKGYLMIPKDLGETVLSFKFNANDLEGRQGTEITTQSVFFIDTVKPSAIVDITALGDQDGIKLDWHYALSDILEFKIYRSSSENLDYTDFYTSVDTNSFYDVSVEKGKTYYYKVSAVDSAGNEGDLSKLVSSTRLIDNMSVIDGKSNGLSLEYLGKVDNFLTEIDSVIGDVGEIKSGLSSKSEKEKILFQDLRLKKEIDSADLELKSLRKDVEKYKLQDLSERELNQKLNSATLKLNIIKKKIPESLVLIGEKSKDFEFSEENVRNLALEINSSLSEKELEKVVQETKKLIEESNLKETGFVYFLEVVYLDGTKQEKTVIKRSISATLESLKNTYFVESIPKDIVENVNELDIKNLQYNIVKEDPVISFSSDNKQILYVINKESNKDLLNEIGFSLVKLDISSEKKSLDITGYFISEMGNKSYFGIVFVIILVFGLLGYFIYLKKNKPSENFLEVLKKIDDIEYSLRKKNKSEVLIEYKELNSKYKNLSKNEKKKIYKIIQEIYTKIQELNKR